MSKIALVESGGGMAACYIAGVTYALAKEFSSLKPDIIIGGSGSTGTLSYYAAEQPESIKNIWLNLLNNKKFINPLRFWRVIDINYLIDEVFKKQDPLRADKIYESKTEYLISSTNHKTGRVEYFSNKKRDDIFEAMRASMALPVAFKYVEVKHQEYCDTDVSASTKLNIEQAIKRGATILLVASVDKLHTRRFTDFFYNLWLERQSWKFLKHYWREEKETFHIPTNAKVVNLAPKSTLKIGTLENKKKKLQEIFEQGYRDTLNNEQLRELLKTLPLRSLLPRR